MRKNSGGAAEEAAVLFLEGKGILHTGEKLSKLPRRN